MNHALLLPPESFPSYAEQEPAPPIRSEAFFEDLDPLPAPLPRPLPAHGWQPGSVRPALFAAAIAASALLTGAVNVTFALPA